MNNGPKLSHSKLDRDGEELLGTIWSAHEDGITGVDTVCARHRNGPCVLAELEKAGYVRLRSGRVELTESGETRAKLLVRRNRLAEVLLEQVLDVSAEETAYTACLWEHMLTREVTDNICTFLGHPRQCPHGKPIPPGDCCKQMSRDVTPLVQPLTSLRIGGSGRISFITPKVHKRLDRLAALGVVPGTSIHLKQKSPSYVIRVGETEIAIEEAVAADIFVREQNSPER